MKKYMLFIALFCSTIMLGSMPYNVPVIITNNVSIASNQVDLICSTTANLTGLNVVTAQTIVTIDTRGVTQVVPCIVENIIIENDIEFQLRTSINISGYTVAGSQQFLFTNPATGITTAIDFIVEDAIVH